MSPTSSIQFKSKILNKETNLHKHWLWSHLFLKNPHPKLKVQVNAFLIRIVLIKTTTNISGYKNFCRAKERSI